MLKRVYSSYFDYKDFMCICTGECGLNHKDNKCDNKNLKDDTLNNDSEDYCIVCINKLNKFYRKSLKGNETTY